MNLSEILKDSNYKLTQFTLRQITKLENTIELKEVRGKEIPFINCLVRRKAIQLKPEEVVRQLYLMVLNEQYGYPFERMGIEHPVSFGREKKRADIVIFDKKDTRSIYIMVELKKPKLKDGKEQLKSYCNATGAPIGVWSNGDSISFYHRKDPNYFEDLSAIPKATEKLSDILTERWTIDDLVKKDKLVTEKKSLKDLILEMEDEVLANAGVDVFEELFKLIFTKLFDEMESGRNKTRHLEFRNYGDTETELKEKIQSVFDNAKNKWEGVFTEDAKIMLTPSHLSVCISSLQDVKLFNSNLDVVDEVFEYLIGKSSKGEKGQYFTPRYVNVSDSSCKSNFVKTKDLPANAKTLVKKGDILISKVRPYRGAVTLINFDQKDLIVSGAFTVLREKETSIFSNEVLKVLLRTKEYKEWLLKFNVGTSYPVIKDIDVLNLSIPKISNKVQETITDKIQLSSNLKKQSEYLLEVAKRAVEIAIEENEDIALEFVKKET